MIDWEAKFGELKRIAALNLDGRASDLAVVLLWHLNPEHGVAFPGADELQDALKASHATVERAASTLVEARVLGSAKRRGSAVRWFRALCDMTPADAKHRVALIQAAWRGKNGSSKMRDHANDPAGVRRSHPSQSSPKVRYLNTPNKSPIVSAGAATVSEDAFRLVETIAMIAGLPSGEPWPRGWRGAPAEAERWLREEGWLFEHCVETARSVMSRRRTADPVQSLRFFERPIRDAWNGIPDLPPRRQAAGNR